MKDIASLQAFVAMGLFASLRYLPVMVIPSLSPFSWAPGMIRIALMFALTWLTLLAAPEFYFRVEWNQPAGLLLACLGELLLGLTFSLAIMLPNAAIGLSARLADMQAGLSAASLFNPAGQHEPESMLGTTVMLAAIVLFFTLDLHLHLFHMLITSAKIMPLGGMTMRLDMDAFFIMVSSSFLLGLSIMAPVILALFAVDIGVAYATRSMPQANVYFLALPLKVAIAFLLLAMTLPFFPTLIGRLYQDSLSRVPAVFGA
jgi:flagellar biosynthesis protein FliR